MQTKVLKRMTADMQKFHKREWSVTDQKHYGRQIDWQRRFYHVRITDGKKILGLLNIHIQAGLGEVVAVMVDSKLRGKGIGKLLMEEAEKFAKEHGAHKIILITGTTWNTADFYKKLGYKVETIFKNHYANTDYYQFYKFIL